MTELIIILITILIIAFMLGTFISIITTVLALAVGYSSGIYGALGVVLVVAIGSIIQKIVSK